MNETKPFWASMTLWGAALAAVQPIATMFGWDMTPDDVDTLGGAIEEVLSAIGLIIVVVGRIRASKPIGPAK